MKYIARDKMISYFLCRREKDTPDVRSKTFKLWPYECKMQHVEEE